MIKLKQAVIVEGKYDKIKLANIIDTVIITTEGFGIFKNTETVNYIKKLADENGIIILTDSDSAGMLIRSKIKGFVSADKITDVYIPRLTGTEKRKTSPGAEGILGVEGVSEEIILNALKNAGVTAETNGTYEVINKTELYAMGLYGSDNATALRKRVCKYLDLPENLTVNKLLAYVNKSNKINELRKAAEICLQKKDSE